VRPVTAFRLGNNYCVQTVKSVNSQKTIDDRNRLRVLRRAALVCLLAASCALVVVAPILRTQVGGRLEGERLKRATQSPNFIGKKFHNLQPPSQSTGEQGREQLKHWLFGNEQRVPLAPIPVVRHHRDEFLKFPSTGLRVTWMGHATALIEIDGVRVLTDPIWSERASPLSFIGPKRFHPVPVEMSELPPIDAVLISHDHYDHLDMRTVRKLASLGTHFIVPLGVGTHFEHWHVPAEQVTELDWNEETSVKGLSIVATPARHYSGRSPFLSNETLWASFVIKTPAHRVFFSGDSGYGHHFRTIGEQYGPFDITLIKIGASDPSWVDIHMTPEQAVQAHIDLRGKRLVPIHWGTFNMGFHAWNEPAERVLAAATSAQTEISIPRPGEFVSNTDHQSHVDPWWRQIK
jgi:L-ascorbate metabolism protein UlaG (beta-lactamase superfamily)